MRGAAVSLPALVLLVFTLPVIQCQNDWGVTCTPTKICAPKGSNAEISCTYRHPTGYNVKDEFWFNPEHSNRVFEDLKTKPNYEGRVVYLCKMKTCTLRISDLRESDSAEYRFRFITNQEDGKWSGPVVRLSVTADSDLQVQVSRSEVDTSSGWAQLKCHSSALPEQTTYIWYKNGQEVQGPTSDPYSVRLNPTDSFSCAVSGQWNFCSPPVYAPKLPSMSVSPSAEIMENSSVTLTCSSDANPAANYTWYKENNTLTSKDPQLLFSSIRSSDSGQYYCEAENKLGKRTSNHVSIDVNYPPKLLDVSVRPSGDIMENSSVTLTCSSDANPAAQYTWYKENQYTWYKEYDHNPRRNKPQLMFSSIQSSDSGQYYCEAENKLGNRTSEYVSIDVKYPPKPLRVFWSPSGDIKENSSVTLTCSSDANPAAQYTWYKENQTMPLGLEKSYCFTSISSEDSGNYYCKSENQYGRINSTSLFVDVQYAPKLPSVSVSPSAEIEEGGSVTLTCSSDANPAASYTWYKENEDSPKASGQNFTITDFRSEHSGNYHCEAWNKIGRCRSPFNLTVVFGAWKLAVIGTTLSFFLAIVFLSVFLLIRKKRASEQPLDTADTPNNREQVGNLEAQDDINYATVYFSKSQADPVYSNVRHQKDKEEVEEVEYSSVQFNSSGSPPRTGDQVTVEDPTALYSTVNKPARHNKAL